MKVLEITCEPILYGGQETFIFNFLENLSDKEIDVDVLTLYYIDNDYYKEIARRRGSNVYELKLDFRPGKSRRLIREPLRKFLYKHHYDIVHIHSGSISALAYSAEVARKSGIKQVIVHSHSTGIDNLRHKIIQYIFKRKFLNYATTFCACSKEAGLMKFPKNMSSEIIVLKNGINLNKYKYNATIRSEIRKNLLIPEDAYVVGQIGRYTFEKNQEFTVNIAKKILKDNKNFYFVLIGDGELKSSVMEKCVGLSNLLFLDSRADVWKYYSVFDLLLLPSLYEGIPIVSIEAQANGLPILASEGVSNEIEINSNVKRVSLDDESVWITTILQRNAKRVDTVEKLTDSSWSIDGTVKRIIEIYKGKVS